MGQDNHDQTAENTCSPPYEHANVEQIMPGRHVDEGIKRSILCIRPRQRADRSPVCLFDRQMSFQEQFASVDIQRIGSVTSW